MNERSEIRPPLELGADVIEFLVDQITKDSLLADIPFVGTMFKAKDAFRSISDSILRRKLAQFQSELEFVDEQEKNLFIERLGANEEFAKRVAEQLLLIIEKVDDMEKPTFIAKCFSCFLRGEITHAFFVDLSQVISRSLTSDLEALAGTDERFRFRNSNIAAASGLLEKGVRSPRDHVRALELGGVLSHYGTHLREIFRGTYTTFLADEEIAREERRAKSNRERSGQP